MYSVIHNSTTKTSLQIYTLRNKIENQKINCKNDIYL